MDTAMAGSFEWELSKENIRPLAQGRLVTQLSLALSKSGDVEVQKRKYEVELRTYVGNDPLDTWCRYIEWASQTCVTGQLDFHLSEKCIRLFCKNDKYKEDGRFVQICYRYAKRCEDRLMVFRAMHDMGIGCKDGLFYKSWAECCEAAGKPKEADVVYEKGLELSKINMRELQHCHKIFLENIANDVRTRANFVNDDQEDPLLERAALGRLNVQKKGNVVPVLRIPIKKAPGQLLNMTSGTDHSMNQRIIIHEDTKDGSKFIEEIHGLQDQHLLSSYVFLPENPFKSKENIKIPQKWSECKVEQQVKQSVSMMEIYEDEYDLDEHKPSINTSGILVLKKLQHSNDDQSSLFTTKQEGEKYICPMHKIYMGSEEFSIEELMALSKYYHSSTATGDSSYMETFGDNVDALQVLPGRSLEFWTRIYQHSDLQKEFCDGILIQEK